MQRDPPWEKFSDPRPNPQQVKKPYHGMLPPRASAEQDPIFQMVIPHGRSISSAVPGFRYKSTKTYTHSVGLSCAFRQWKADHSHCQYLHGYALKVHLEFEASHLDDRNWVQDFGGLKDVKKFLENHFDHKTLVAADDPKISIFRELHTARLIQLVIVPSVGVESFARIIYENVAPMIEPYGAGYLDKVIVHEHEANSAEYGRIDSWTK